MANWLSSTFGGGGSKNMPKAPDPNDTANAQTRANIAAAEATTRLNRVNEISPYGASLYIPPGRSDMFGSLPAHAVAPALGSPRSASPTPQTAPTQPTATPPWTPPAGTAAPKEKTLANGAVQYFDPDKNRWKEKKGGKVNFIDEPDWYRQASAAPVAAPQTNVPMPQIGAQPMAAPSAGGKSSDMVVPEQFRGGSQPAVAQPGSNKANQPYQRGRDPEMDAMMQGATSQPAAPLRMRTMDLQPQDIAGNEPASTNAPPWASPNMQVLPPRPPSATPRPQVMADAVRGKPTNQQLLAMGVPADQLPDNNSDDGGSANDTGPGGAYDHKDWMQIGQPAERNGMENVAATLGFGLAADGSAIYRNAKAQAPEYGGVDKGQVAGQAGAALIKSTPVGALVPAVRATQWAANKVFGPGTMTDSYDARDFYTDPQGSGGASGGADSGNPPAMDMRQMPDGTWSYAGGGGGGYDPATGRAYGGSPDPGFDMEGGRVSGGDYDEPWTRVSYLHPEEQANLDKQRALTQAILGTGQEQVGRVRDAVAKPLSFDGAPSVDAVDFSKLPALPGVNDFSADRDKVVDTLYQRDLERLNPQFERQRAQIEQRLASQGITIQSNPEAYGKAMDELNRARTDAMGAALARAQAAGGGEQSRMFGQGMQARQQMEREVIAKFQSGQTSRQQAIQEILALRNQPLNEMVTMMGAAPSVSTPQFTPQPMQSIAPADIAGPTMQAYQGDLARYQTDVNRQNANMGAMSSLAGAGLMAYASKK